jgi:hypothetical protein
VALEEAAEALGGPRRFKLRVGRAVKYAGQAPAAGGGVEAAGLHFSASAAIAGSESRAKVRVNIIWPDPASPGWYFNALAGGAIGTRVRAGGMPMYGVTDVGESGTLERGQGRLGPVLTRLEKWSTPSLATSTRRTPDGGSVVVVDDHRAMGPEGVNLLLANLTRFGADSERLLIVLNSPVLTPSRRLVADVYIERTLAARLVPRAGVFLNSPAVLVDPSGAWRSQVPQRVRVEALGPGLHASGTDAWAGHEMLTAELAAGVGVEPASLLGYRIDVENPLWGMAYCVWFEFAGV